MTHPEPKKNRLLSPVALSIFSFVLVVVLSQCSSDDDKTSICSPANVFTGSDSIVYVYDGNNHLAEIQTLGGKTVSERYVMTYTDGKLTQCTHSFPQVSGPDLTTETFTFSYGSNGKPATRTYAQGSGPTFETIVYSYDEKDRLTQRVTKVFDSPIMSTRYEYNGDNVSKIYYVQSPGDDEILGAELLNFDNHQRFFAGSPDLILVETYIFNYEPSINNVMAMKISATPGTTYGVAFSYTWQIGYNEQGYVKSITTVNSNGYLFPIFTFSRMNYTCR
ncbi:hypothetical protein SAMN04488109_4425 [Chryseolinea serpens]|uniref:YD repeat-containing protein n=1 Tax=Chryseolinea serpens TaxID=947013 RepID=A0A1M5U2G0_9BACT|nr:hypothetical protein [Chryseolinea serpens]SHH57275.1 hypothetical protein SAMN04488109_4425 [Chryseolinea serpens]